MNRKFVFALAFCLTCSVTFLSSAALAAGKIGVANLAAVTAQSAPGQDAEKQLQSMFGKERTQLESQAAALNKKAEDLNKQAAALSEKARNDKAQELQTQARDLDAKSGAYTQRLSGVQQALTAQMQDVLATACANFAKKNGYDLIIDGAAVMYATDATNVTAGLVEEVNKVWKSKGSKFNLGAAAAPKK